MYARVTTFHVQPGKLDEVNQIASKSIMPAIKQQTGLHSFLGLQDPETGKAMLITLFETEADMQTGLNNGFIQQQVAKIAPMLTGIPTTELFVVRFQE